MSFQMLVLLRVHIFHGFASCCGAKRRVELYPGRRFSGAWIYAISVGKRFSRGFLTAVRKMRTPFLSNSILRYSLTAAGSCRGS